MRVLLGQRCLDDLIRRSPRQLERVGVDTLERTPIAEHRSMLLSDLRPSEKMLQLGKIQNLRIASQRLEGRLIRTHDVFSFRHHVGRPVERNG